jgi:protein arginine N-methyltransferase 1
MYNIYEYGLMLADGRGALHAEALRRVVRPGSVVVDLGAGPCVLGAYACRLGARRVFAIEPDDVIAIGREIAVANGFADRITFVQQDSRHAALPEKADVVIADIRGVLPFAGTGLEATLDARRFLRPGGVLIPGRDRLFVALVDAPDLYASIVNPWAAQPFDLDLTPARRINVNLWRRAKLEATSVRSEPVMWGAIDYGSGSALSISGAADLSVTQAGVAHGLAVWFECDLLPDLVMSNRPGDPPLIYGQGFFPWPEALRMDAGESVHVELRAMYTGEEYLFAWDTVVTSSTGAERARFRQSTLAGLPLDLASTHARAAEAVITPGPEAEIERFVLTLLDGTRSQGEIAAALAVRYPDRFAGPEDALARVADVGLRAARNGGVVALRD